MKSLLNVVLTSNSNLPDVLWDKEGGYLLKPSPAHGMEVNTKLLGVKNDHSMFQHVEQATRKGNILDLVLTTNPNLVQNVQVVEGMNDHNAALVDIALKPSFNRKQLRKVLLYKKDDVELDRNDLKLQGLDNYLTDNQVMKKLCPLKKLGLCWNVPWMNS